MRLSRRRFAVIEAQRTWIVFGSTSFRALFRPLEIGSCERAVPLSGRVQA